MELLVWSVGGEDVVGGLGGLGGRGLRVVLDDDLRVGQAKRGAAVVALRVGGHLRPALCRVGNRPPLDPRTWRSTVRSSGPSPWTRSGSGRLQRGRAQP